MIIVTHMEQEAMADFQQDLPDAMKDIIHKCAHRIVAFENKTMKEAKDNQIEQFFKATQQLPTQRLQVTIKHQIQAEVRSEDLNLLLIGCKGNGKSSTANTIVGEHVFVVSQSGTQKCQTENTVYKPPWCDDLEFVIGVTDTPGASEEMTESEFDQLEKAVHECPEGFDAIILVWPDRMSQNIAKMEKKAFQSLHRMFGDRLFHHLLIAVTGTTQDSIKKYCQDLPESLRFILQRSVSITAFDNKYEKANTKAIKQLITAAQDIKNNGRYTKEDLSPTCQIPPGDELRMAVIGKTGVGKSSTANTIVGSKEFRVTCSASSETTKSAYTRRQKTDRKIAVVDTPGICDTSADPEVVGEEIARMATILSEGLHALLLVVRLSRFTQEEIDAIAMLKELFGKNFMQYVVIVLSHKDEIDSDDIFKGDVKKYIETAPEKFRELLKDCGQRYVAFNNVTEDETLKRMQVAELVKLVEDTIGEQAKIPFKDVIFAEGQHEKEKIRQELLEERVMQHRPSVQALRCSNESEEFTNKSNRPNRATEQTAALSFPKQATHTGQRQELDNERATGSTPQDATGSNSPAENECQNVLENHPIAITTEVEVVIPVVQDVSEFDIEELEEMARQEATNRSFKNTKLYKTIMDKLQRVRDFFDRIKALMFSD
ncbi:GTPase IMAP family member 8-like [Branchiostoma floridae]|uniref:GTPase IMAP family member 8-like n=2 Tax=Branchiostoma floridae TaxID=7739 RepID=A0A9J7KZE2_BRAFL|nr:GTPase IMAP family member 8-like [Branchiostoma floridae]